MATTRISVRKHAVVPGLVALVAMLAAPVIMALPGEAAPRPTIAQVEARVNTLNDEAEAANEKRNALNDQVAATSARAAKVRQRIATESASLAKVRGQLGVFASAAYRSGGLDSTLELMLSDKPSDFLDQTSSLDAVARGQQAAMRRVAAAQQRLDQSRIELSQTLKQQRTVAGEAAAQSAAINAKADEARRLLGSLRADERRKLEAAQAARAAASARASRAALRHAPSYGHHGGGSGGGSNFHSYSGPASGRASAAVAYAMAQVGKSYSWGASGPNSFDCSGLTMAAWRQAGVSLPHYTVAQYGATRHVSRGSMQPGDLIFFHSDMHHVGIYIGGGMFVHAQSSATGVVVSSISGWWSGSITGVGRP